jgi:GTP-binding protein
MKGLSKRPGIIIANKMDLPQSQENFELLQEAVGHLPMEIIPISAEQHDHLDILIRKLREMVVSSGGSIAIR